MTVAPRPSQPGTALNEGPSTTTLLASILIFTAAFYDTKQEMPPQRPVCSPVFLYPEPRHCAPASSPQAADCIPLVHTLLDLLRPVS